MTIVGVLLAAGSATRFGGDKLLSELADGQCIAGIACARLRPAVDRLLAVVRPEATALAARLAAAGAEICTFAGADQGMGASLAYGVRQAPDADGWLARQSGLPIDFQIQRRTEANIQYPGQRQALGMFHQAKYTTGHP